MPGRVSAESRKSLGGVGRGFRPTDRKFKSVVTGVSDGATCVDADFSTSSGFLLAFLLLLS
jgi:hypothetical protein